MPVKGDYSNPPVQSLGKSRIAFLLPLVGYAMFLMEGVFAPPNPTWALLLLLWTLGTSVLAWWLARGGARAIFLSLDRHASSIILGMIAIAAVMLVVASIVQARQFALSVHAEDTAYYNQVVWNTLHGNFLSGNVQQERLFIPPVTNDLALHVSPVLYLGILPIYALFPHFLTLLVVRDLALAAAAWPLFILARERLGGAGGVAAAALYLMNPAVIAQGVEAFYPLQLAPLPFFFALRAFVRQEFGTFLCWMGIAIGLREDIAITMAGFGLWALMTRRPWRWWSCGLAIPALWWGIVTLLIQPAFGRWGNNVSEIAFAGGNHAPLGLYQLIFGNPTWILDMLREGGAEYLYRVLRSVAFLSVLGVEGILAAPVLGATLSLGRVLHSATEPFSRFALLPSCALIGTAVVITSRIARRWHWDMRVVPVIVLLLLPSVSLLDGAKDAVQARLTMYTVRNDATALRQALGRIPDAASVAAPNYALPALSHRPKLFYVTYLYMYPQAQPDYIFLDGNIDRITINPELRERYVALLDRLSHSTEYDTIWQTGDYALLQRKSAKTVAM